MDANTIPPRRAAPALAKIRVFDAPVIVPETVPQQSVPQQAVWVIEPDPAPAPMILPSTLQGLNVAAAAIHGALAGGFALYFLSKLAEAPSGVELLPLSVYTHSRPRAALKRGRISERAVATGIVMFFALTCAAHTAYALDFGGFYSSAVARGNSWFRWLEYSVTATIMTLVISVTGGVRDLYAVVCLAALTVSIMATGQWFEREARRRDSLAHALTPLAVGFGLLGVVWYVVISSFRDRVDEIESTPGAEEIPPWIIAAIVTTLLFFSAFGIVPLVQLAVAGGKTGGRVRAWYPKAETAYIALSILAKAALAAFLAYGFGERIDAA